MAGLEGRDTFGDGTLALVHFGAGDFEQVREAVRDILFLYRDLTDYHGLVGDHDTGTFKPWSFLNCTVDGERAGDTRLLHQGAAIALISGLIDRWSQGNGQGVEVFSSAIEQGRFAHLPAAHAAVSAGLDGEAPMVPFLDRVYEEYVLAYFAALAQSRGPYTG